MSIRAKIAKLEEKSRVDCKHVVAAAASDLLNNLANIDCQINLLGSMHEVGLLQNSFTPYWNEFRTDESTWANKCLSRLLISDADYWAVAALLGCRNAAVVDQVIALGFTFIATWRYSRFDKPDVHVSTFFKNRTGGILLPLIEVGFNAESGVVVDFVRARSLALNDEHWQVGQPVGKGSMSYFMRATLPHGAWRMRSSEFEIKQESLVGVAT